MDSVGVGIIGSGYMALTYAEAMTKHNQGVRLVAVAGGRRAPALAAEYGVAAEPSIEALLARPDVDAVLLATPEAGHLRETQLAAAAGKHVLSEKPMAPDIAQCDGMIEACRAAGVNLAVVQTERYRGVGVRTKQLIDTGRIGRVRSVNAVATFSEADALSLASDKPWVNDPANGGLFLNMGVHCTDTLRHLIGSPPVRVFADMTTYGAAGQPNQSCMAQILFANGVTAHLWVCAELPRPGLPHQESRYTIIGDTGMLDADYFAYLDMGSGDSWERIWTQPTFDYLREPKSPIRLEAHAGVTQEFVNSILEQRRPEVGGEEGRAAVEICEACLRSAQTGQAVQLPLA